MLFKFLRITKIPHDMGGYGKNFCAIPRCLRSPIGRKRKLRLLEALLTLPPHVHKLICNNSEPSLQWRESIFGDKTTEFTNHINKLTRSLGNLFCRFCNCRYLTCHIFSFSVQMTVRYWPTVALVGDCLHFASKTVKTPRKSKFTLGSIPAVSTTG